jgi:CheY-like chemotaxis protein
MTGLLPGPAHPRHVLVVDDSPLIREVARFAHESAGGLSVATAETGAEGLAAASADTPDAVLLDVVMPEMDGLATARALRERDETRAVPVVLMTARDKEEDLRAFAELGVTGVIPKPFDAGTLAAQLRELLGWR